MRARRTFFPITPPKRFYPDHSADQQVCADTRKYRKRALRVRLKTHEAVVTISWERPDMIVLS